MEIEQDYWDAGMFVGEVEGDSETESSSNTAFAQHHKEIHFSGLTIELFEDEIDCEIAGPQSALGDQEIAPLSNSVPGR